MSLEIPAGQIVGLLGPNGAGKSTLMKILIGLWKADSGEVQAPVRIGYLPENNPLYDEMYVAEYLEFMAGMTTPSLRGRDGVELVATLIDLVGLTPERHKHIRELSKGYRQRVGLAQALIGDPPVLILDEPTVGLDPQQIIEIRRLIRELGKKHTIILSSHLLSEVQAVCDKILIINKGRIVADELTSSLTGTGSSTEKLRLIVEGRKQQVQSVLQKVDGVVKVTDMGEAEKGCCEFTVDSRRDVRRLIFRALAKTDFSILEMSPVEQSLEDTYLNIITGKNETKEEATDVSDI